MKIIYFHQYFSTPKGKAGLRSYYFAKKLVKEGHEVFIICLNDTRTNCGLDGKFKNGFRKGVFEGINIIQLDLRYSNYKSFFKRSLIFLNYSIISTKLALKINPEIIIATSTPLTVTLPAIFMRWLYGIPFIFEVRDLWPSLPIAMGILKNKFIIKILIYLEKISYASADFIIGLAPGICDEISKKGISKEKLIFIPNIADINLFKNNKNLEKKDPLLLKRYDPSIEKSSLITSFTGAHGFANGLENIIEVANELKNMNRNDIKFFFIGEGSLKEKLKNQAQFYKLKNCIFLDSMPKEDLAKILNDSVHIGLMVLKNIKEFYYGTSPNKFFDYLASGLPVINNYPGWISEMIKKNNLGYVVPPDNQKLFAKKLIEISDNKNDLNKFSANCKYYAEKNFSPEVLSYKFYQVVKETFVKYKTRHKNYLKNIVYSFIKSFIDKTLALFLIIILSPLFILISVIVYIQLGFPIFFVQERPGFKNKIFKLIKFKSMKNPSKNCKDSDNDSIRLDSFGKFFRSTSLDELPELFNVLKGDMSFVGPRPLLKEYLEIYSTEQIKRHDVKPGITGLAQIKGRNLLNWENRFKFDLFYVKNKSLALDLKILIITTVKVLIRDGINSKNSVTCEKLTSKSQRVDT